MADSETMKQLGLDVPIEKLDKKDIEKKGEESYSKYSTIDGEIKTRQQRIQTLHAQMLENQAVKEGRILLSDEKSYVRLVN